MHFSKESRDVYLSVTEIDNIFINEYMPQAPSNYVKVYLYGQFLAKTHKEMDTREIADYLDLTEEDVLNAWNYWEGLGLLKRGTDESQNGDVRFADSINMLYGIKNTKKDEKTYNDSADEYSDTESTVNAEDALNDSDIKTLLDGIEEILGKTLNIKDMRSIDSWVEELGIRSDMILETTRYCISKGKDSIAYIGKVLMAWAEEGLKTGKDCEEKIAELSERQFLYKAILQSLGLSRNITEPERKMINSWVEDYGFTKERIMEACERAGFTQSPNLKYVNKVLENWASEAKAAGRNVNQRITISNEELKNYLEYIRQDAINKAKQRKDEVYRKIPRIAEIDILQKNLSAKISRGIIGGFTKQEIETTRKELDALETERAVLLTENNFRIDYTDIKYACEKCKDTGTDENGRKCTCIGERIGEAEIWQKSKANETTNIKGNSAN